LFRTEAREYYKMDDQQIFEKALGLYRQAIKLAPDDFILCTDYAEAFYGTHPPRWKDGLEAWSQALRLARDEGEREGVRLHLARMNLELGNYDQARLNLDSVTNVNYAKLKNSLAQNLTNAMAKERKN
jgi:tetratricopeptide (TPR) repeat protein